MPIWFRQGDVRRGFKHMWPQNWGSSPIVTDLDTDFIKHLQLRRSICFSLKKKGYSTPSYAKLPWRFVKSLRKLSIKTLKLHPLHEQSSHLQLKSLNCLKLEGNWSSCRSKKLLTKKILLTSRNLKSLHLGNNTLSLAPVRKHLASLNKLVSLYLDGFGDNSLNHFWHTFLKRPLSIQHLTVEFSRYISRPSVQKIYHMMNQIIELPKLKSVRFLVDLNLNFDTNSISFDIFKQKNIAYDIRVTHSGSPLIFSDANLLGLSDLQLLGISPRYTAFDRVKWTFAEEEHARIQERCKKLLFLNISTPMVLVDKTCNAFDVCKSVHTLDLILDTKLLELINFSPLKDLKLLENIFIRIGVVDRSNQYDEDGIDIPEDGSAGLFENLTLCQIAHRNLRTVSISVEVMTLPRHFYKSMQNFMEACNLSVQKIMLNLYYSPSSDGDCNHFYSALTMLKKVRSINITTKEVRLYSPRSIKVIEAEYSHILEALQDRDSLEELSLDLPNLNLPDFDATIRNMRSLKKLNIYLVTSHKEEAVNCNLICSLMKSSQELQHLELIVPNLSKIQLDRLLKSINHQQKMESVKIECGQESGVISDIKGIFETLLKTHKNLEAYSL